MSLEETRYYESSDIMSVRTLKFSKILFFSIDLVTKEVTFHVKYGSLRTQWNRQEFINFEDAREFYFGLKS